MVLRYLDACMKMEYALDHSLIAVLEGLTYGPTVFKSN